MHRKQLTHQIALSLGTLSRVLLPGCALVTVFITLLLMPIFAPSLHSQEAKVFLREDFDNLENWRPLHFPKISRHSSYGIEAKGGEAFLRAESEGAASALIFGKTFSVYDYPMARWRWKVDNVYNNINPEIKSGDDYPIRIYILFQYDPEIAGFLDRAKYGLAKTIYGQYPPFSTLSYVWASKEEQKTIMSSPYTDRAKVISLEKGIAKVGTWVNEEVNILDTYRRAFGEDPPASASMAVMNDSDDSGQKSVSYLDFIEVFK